ncbi:CGNR zinc finger domain-containing protein [Auraticoccus monumenti]|uniref:CGNR zinc finger domain-containing protein n=2 Tax=Auraticoccus monumenti TaxID=675864 RepID=A0A1G6WIX3_9ACTN|nr:CGNR zinc finger domain-containing protein [Auraticoccus monumenti]
METWDGTPEELVLEVLNTTPTVDGTQRDLLSGEEGAALVRRWGGTGEGDRRNLVAARDAVQQIVTTGRTDVDLHALLDEVVQRPRLGTDGLTWRLDAPPAAVLALEFLATWTRLTTEHPGRLRRCANDECSRYLLDRSNANARQWCSMSSCGNRMKARRHHRRSAARG